MKWLFMVIVLTGCSGNFAADFLERHSADEVQIGNRVYHRK